MHSPAQSIAQTIAAIRRDLKESNDASAFCEGSGLSPAEIAMIPEATLPKPKRPKGLPVTEIDCDVTFSGVTFPMTLAVWGKYHAPRKGGHEPGERAYEPDDPASFDVDYVMFGETDITGDLSQSAIEEIAGHVIENCYNARAK